MKSNNRRERAYLVNQRPSVNVVIHKYLRPQIEFATLDEITSLLLEHRIFVGDRNQLFVAETLCIGYVRQIWVTSLAKATDNKRIIELRLSILNRI